MKPKLGPLAVVTAQDRWAAARVTAGSWWVDAPRERFTAFAIRNHVQRMCGNKEGRLLLSGLDSGHVIHEHERRHASN